MREKYLWLAISVLTALTLGQACYIYEEKAAATEFSDQPPPVQPEIHREAHSEKAYNAQQEEFEKWRRKVREQINQGFQLGDPDFDAFFGDSFFSGRPSPFAEMERVRRQLADEFRDSDKQLFDGYWNKWYGRRMRLGEFKADVIGTDKDVTLTIQVPGLAAKTADISITGDRIRLSFSAKASSEEKKGGGLIKRESYQSYLKIMPVPEDAAAGTGKVEITGERVTIRFQRKRN